MRRGGGELCSLTAEFTVHRVCVSHWHSLCWCGDRRLTRQGGLDLLVDDNLDAHAPLRRGLEHVVEAVPLVRGRRPPEVKLGTQPPVEDVDALLCGFAGMALSIFGTFSTFLLRENPKRQLRIRKLTLERLGHGPEVRGAVDVPLCAAGGDGGEGAMAVVAVVVRVDVEALVARVGVGMLLLVAGDERLQVGPGVLDARFELAVEVHGGQDTEEGVVQAGWGGWIRVLVD